MKSPSLFFAVLFAATAVADTLGPVTVHLDRPDAQGKRVPVAHVPVTLDARNADTDAQGNARFDGVPVGRHTLKVRLPHHAAVEKTLELAAGVRPPVDVTLQATPGVTWRGNLHDRVSGQAIVGAVVTIEPVAVAAAIHGKGLTTSDWEGLFEFVDLPPGRYALRATAPGFAPLAGEYRVKPAEEGSREFANPQVDGLALDICLTWGASCGKPAADAWCKRQGMGESIAHRVRNDTPPTRVIASGQKCEAEHCDRIEWLHCAGPGEADDLRMEPVTTPAAATVQVRDSRSGQPIAGARVTLAETWPAGEVSSGVTDAAGKLVFANLKTGAANWWGVGMGAANKLDISRRQLTARIEAVGYAAGVFRVNLNETTAVSLNPTAEQAKVEPNDLASPQDVLTGAPIRFAIGQNNDHDVFRFHLAEPARLVVALAADTPLETHLRLRDAQGKLITERGAYRGQENRIETGLAAGTYFVDVSEWGENASAPDKPMLLTLDATPATDPNEPNDTLESAVPIAVGERPSGLIWPQGDHDHYRIEIPRPGLLRLREPGMPLERHVRLLDRDGKLLAEQGVYSGNPLDFSAKVGPGSHFIEIMEWGNNGASLTPYRLRLELIPDDGIDDPAIGGSPVRTLAPGERVHATLLPRGDVDLYGVALPGAGTLRVQSLGRLERHLQLFDRGGRLLTERGVYADQSNELEWSVAAADTVYLAIREWGDNGESPSAYSLSTWFDPADDIDFIQRNDDFEHATPIATRETVRGNYLPRGDRDVYVLEADFPGFLRVKAKSGLETHVRIFDAQRKMLAESGVYAGQTAEIAPAIAAGTHYVMIGEWGDNHGATVPYEMSVALERAEPNEGWPMPTDAPRRLKDGEAQAFSIDQIRDVDRFLFETAQAGTITVQVAAPLETLIHIYDDQTGRRLHESGHYAPALVIIPLKLDAPARLRIELREWGDNNASLKAGFVMADSRGRALAAARIEAQAVADDPLRFVFRMQPLEKGEAARRCEIDLNRDGAADFSLEAGTPREHRFAAAGLYQLEAHCQGGNGQSSRQRFWVLASPPRPQSGIALFLPSPAQDQALSEPIALQAHALSYDGKRIARVEFSLDGQPPSRDYTAPYTAAPAWQALPPGQHTLAVTAYDTAGTKAVLQRGFTLSEYFGLTPADGAVLSGDQVRVTWSGQDFGPAKVRYRKQGAQDWQEAVGQSGRTRSVVLTDLAAATPHEFQPVGATFGPLRTLTRVKGLAFGAARYGANLRRDYGQKVGISVRNNGDKPLKVRLECGRPKDPLLLVGFVGEGSEDQPIDLAPGEARQFVLGISAQDVVSADHSFPVRIVSADGLSDEAEVAVHVQLPRIDLAWEDRGASPDGSGRVYRLHNKGDTVTDLEVGSEAALNISPTVRHGLLQGGQYQDFTVSPQFHPGFTGISTRLVARALNQRFEQAYAMHLAPGESVWRVWLFPGQSVDSASERQAIAAAERAQALRPESVDWRHREHPEDSDQDGRPDRWSQQIGDTRWVGEDTDGDAAIDFVHADIGMDGAFEYSAWLNNGRWHPTNLVEAWLEMGFSLPWNRASYQPHDAEIVLNDVVIGRLKDAIPDGNYAFRIPPRALKFAAGGQPGDNRVGIRSQHLRGGHYVVNSDFRFKFRLTATPVWMVAKTAAQARANAERQAGVSLAAADFSVSAADMRFIGPKAPKAGDDMQIEFSLRNLGAAAPAEVPVVLSRTLPNGTREELARIAPDHIALDTPTRLQIPFKARGGQLTVTVDPERVFADSDRNNNSGSLFLQVAGDDKPPELQVQSPVDAQQLADGSLKLTAQAQDEQGIASLSIAIDGGLWQDLDAKDGAVSRDLLLQPGSHRLQIKAVDFADSSVVVQRQVQVTAAAPKLRLLAPLDAASIDTRSVQVHLEVPPDAALVAVRTAGGPWYRGRPDASGQVKIELPVNFGDQALEALVADRNGIVASASTRVTSTRQAVEGDVLPTAAAHGLIWPANRPGLQIDLFNHTSGLLVPADPRAQAVQADAIVTPPAVDADLQACQAREAAAEQAAKAAQAQAAQDIQSCQTRADALHQALDQATRRADALQLRLDQSEDAGKRADALQTRLDAETQARQTLDAELRQAREEMARLQDELQRQRAVPPPPAAEEKPRQGDRLDKAIKSLKDWFGK